MNRKSAYTLTEAQKRIANYCAYQERCHKDVRAKLQDMGLIPMAIDHMITFLIQENYLNEERFAKSFVRGKFNTKKWGKARIIRELRFREISKYNIKSALQEIDDASYTQTLHLLALKRLQHIRETQLQKKRKKLADYLLYRGWESDLVYAKVRELVP